MDEFSNVYADRTRAEAYAGLEFPGTYYLAYRDLPALIAAHVDGRRAVDFGCGAGRSTRFLQDLGFDVVGVDVAEEMLAEARARDPEGDYRLARGDDVGGLPAGAFDLVLAAFTFDNVPSLEEKATLFRALARRLAAGGRILTVVSSPEIYVGEWASFSTKDFPENRAAESGDLVRIVMLDVPDARPVEDVLCSPEDYAEVHRRAGLEAVEVLRPLGRPDEPQEWVSECEVAPWTIHVLRAVGDGEPAG
jgi:SAM-dependent methyltransferase